MSKHMKNLLLHFLLIFVSGTLIGLVYVHNNPALHVTTLAVVGLSLVAATTATVCLAITDRITGRR